MSSIFTKYNVKPVSFYSCNLLGDGSPSVGWLESDAHISAGLPLL